MNDQLVVSPDQARQVANKFLRNLPRWDCEHGGGPQFQLGSKCERLWLSRTVPAYEFAILTKLGARSGFVLVSGSRDHHPILEYCAKGRGLSANLRTALQFFFKTSVFRDQALRRKAKKAKIYYLGPFDMVAEITKSRDEYLYVRVPNIHFAEAAEMVNFHLLSTGEGAPNKEAWTYYLSPEDISLPLDCAVLSWHVPRRYQQLCRPGTTSEVANYCHPRCISGCSPVAWAGLASSFRTYNEFSRMQVDNAHFDQEWTTYEINKPADAVVDAVIWDAHTYMDTTCGGDTKTRDLVTGAWIFRRWRYDCAFGLADSDVYFARDIIRGGFAFMLSAQAQWSTLGLPGDDGHVVVVYGYNTTMFSDHILICLGWGTGYPNKWVSMSQLRQPKACYLSRITPLSSEEGPLPDERSKPSDLHVDSFPIAQATAAQSSP